MKAYVYLTTTGSFVFKRHRVEDNSARQLIGTVDMTVLSDGGFQMPESQTDTLCRRAEANMGNER